MKNVIQLLEKLGTDSELQNVDQATIDAINEAYLDPEIKTALKGRDFNSLETLLRTKFKIYCVLFPAKEDEEKPDEEEREDDDSEEKEEKSSLRAFS